jgi:hypothetical protein
MSDNSNPTLINGFEDVMAHIRKLEEENKKLKEKYENATKRENNLMSSIESDVIVFEFIDHIGAIQCNKEDIDNYTENQSARETLYSLADIELPEEDEE